MKKQISLLRKSISRKNLAQHEAHDCCARVGVWKECRFMQQSRPHLVLPVSRWFRVRWLDRLNAAQAGFRKTCPERFCGLRGDALVV